jgi:hypothetical protein
MAPGGGVQTIVFSLYRFQNKSGISRSRGNSVVLFAMTSGPDWGSNHPPTQWVPSSCTWGNSRGVKLHYLNPAINVHSLLLG